MGIRAWPSGHGELIESGYPSLSGPHLSDGSHIMETDSTMGSGLDPSPLTHPCLAEVSPDELSCQQLFEYPS